MDQKNRTPVAGCVLVLALLLISSTAFGKDYDRMVDTFFSKVAEGKPLEAIDLIYGTNPWMSKASDAVQNLRNQFASLEDLVGKYCGHELLIEEVVANRFVYLHYFVAYDRQPMGFHFKFYKPRDQWVLFGFSFDDDIDDEIVERAKKALSAK
jgi:hypothetical protein